MLDHFQTFSRLLAFAATAVLLTACSALLLGEGASRSPALGESSRISPQSSADNALADAVRGVLATDDSLRSENLAVSARNGVVILSGVVVSFDARDRAVQLASEVSGVSRVVNQLHVKTQHQ